MKLVAPHKRGSFTLYDGNVMSEYDVEPPGIRFEPGDGDEEVPEAEIANEELANAVINHYDGIESGGESEAETLTVDEEDPDVEEEPSSEVEDSIPESGEADVQGDDVQRESTDTKEEAAADTREQTVTEDIDTQPEEGPEAEEEEDEPERQENEAISQNEYTTTEGNPDGVESTDDN